MLKLIDVFSYSCMNCLRSYEYIKKIDSRYKKHGLKTIIIHPYEWNFEKNSNNVLSFVKSKNIGFPALVDKKRMEIKKLGIDFWPAQILVKNGKIIYRHIGEGNYKKLEEKIKIELGVKNKNIFVKEPKYSKYSSVYCGTRKKGEIIDFNENSVFGKINADKGISQKKEFIIAKKDAKLKIQAVGKIVNFTAECNDSKKSNVSVFLKKNIVKTVNVKFPMMYQIAKFRDSKKRVLELKIKKGVRIYSFSFQ